MRCWTTSLAAELLRPPAHRSMSEVERFALIVLITAGCGRGRGAVQPGQRTYPGPPTGDLPAGRRRRLRRHPRPRAGVGHHRPAGGDGGPCGHLVRRRDADRLAAVPRGRWSGSVSPAPSSPPRRWRHWPISCSAWSGGGGVAAGHGAGPHRPGGGVLGARAPRGHGRSGTILGARPASTTRVDRISGEASVMIACLASILPSQLDRLIALAGLGRPGGWGAQARWRTRRLGRSARRVGRGRQRPDIAASVAACGTVRTAVSRSKVSNTRARAAGSPVWVCWEKARAAHPAARPHHSPEGGPRRAAPTGSVLQLALIGVVGGPSRRCSSRGSAGQASSRTGRGTLRAA